MKLRVTIIALLEILFGAIVFSSAWWLSHAQHETALYTYGVVAAIFGVATISLLRPK